MVYSLRFMHVLHNILYNIRHIFRVYYNSCNHTKRKKTDIRELRKKFSIVSWERRLFSFAVVHWFTIGLLCWREKKRWTVKRDWFTFYYTYVALFLFSLLWLSIWVKKVRYLSEEFCLMGCHEFRAIIIIKEIVNIL